jgi:hypothetical protein
MADDAGVSTSPKADRELGAGEGQTEPPPTSPPPEPGMSEALADRLAALMVATPSLRAEFFANPVKTIGTALPSPRYWSYKDSAFCWPWWWRHPIKFGEGRRLVVHSVFERVADQVIGKELSSSINTDSVFDEFFSPIVRVSQRSYTSVYLLSWLTFLVGTALIGVGTYVGVHPPKGVDGTIVASIFGGSGAISALASVFAMAVSSIRQASSDLAKVRVVLTAFATQLGQLRAYAEENSSSSKSPSLNEIVDLNRAIMEAMDAALAGMPQSPNDLASTAKPGAKEDADKKQASDQSLDA